MSKGQMIRDKRTLTFHRSTLGADARREPVIDLQAQITEAPVVTSVVEDVRFVPRRWEASKRAIDIALALIGLTLTLPFLVLALIAICVSSPGNPFFIQNRIGQGGRAFRILKLRTMIPNADRHDQPILKKQRNDQRIFPVGKLLRKTSLDEIPNLINVLAGQMSIVGPRPLLTKEHEHCVERHGLSAAMQRLSTRPGVTGLWQISGRAELHFDDRIDLDIRYAMTWTPIGDIKIIMKTIPVLLFGHGAY